MDISQQELISTACALLLASIGSFHDLRDRRIPNMLSGPGILAGLAVHTMLSGWRGMGDAALAGFIAGGLSLAFWIAGGMGAGDVKLMAAIGCITGTVPLYTLLVSTAVAAGLFALAVSIFRGRLRETLQNVAKLVQHHRARGLAPHPEINVKRAGALSLPFALPVAAGCMVTLCGLVLEARQ